MDRHFASLLIGGVLAAQLLTAGAGAAQNTNTLLTENTEGASVKVSSLPALPRGRSTIIGGEIQKLDTVRDQFQLKAFGLKPMTILCDERTQVYLDGKKIPLRDLRSGSIASIETVLDGTNVFAIGIHLLSRAPEGEYQGQVLSYRADTRELTISAASSRDPLKLVVPMNTPIARVGQGALTTPPPGSADLVKGTLVSLTFEPNRAGQGIASRIEILATPGSAFVFGGSLSSLDMHTGKMTVTDPSDEKTYQIVFDPSRVPTMTLHEGDNIRVAATYDGSRYVASSIVLN